MTFYFYWYLVTRFLTLGLLFLSGGTAELSEAELIIIFFVVLFPFFIELFSLLVNVTKLMGVDWDFEFHVDRS